jgi:hypothetical protein
MFDVPIVINDFADHLLFRSPPLEIFTIQEARIDQLNSYLPEPTQSNSPSGVT